MEVIIKKRLDNALNELARQYRKGDMIKALRDGKLSKDDILGLQDGIAAAYYSTNNHGGQDVMIFAPCVQAKQETQ